MKVFYKKRHVKTVPRKYSGVKNICDYFDDFEKKRLSKSERSSIDIALLKSEIDLLKDSIRANTSVFRLVENEDPILAVEVTTKHSTYEVLKFPCGVEIKCRRELFNQFPYKKTIKRLF